MSGRALIAAAALLLVSPVAAQPRVTSARPDAVEVTVYRNPNRPAAVEMELDWLEGFALITETRRVSLPAGDSVLRFEGVAGGIVPESAIVTGLPSGVVEKNQDAELLSPASLLDASLGRRVHIRRTSPETGAVTQSEAVVRTGADGAVVLETADGFEALRCTGLPETLLFDRVPDGVVASPTLSVRVRSPAPVSAMVKLSYLATGFDWQADYVAELSADGRSVDLFAWLTLANGDESGFREADTNAVAGRLKREDAEPDYNEVEPIRLTCWPQGRSSDVPATPIMVVSSQEVKLSGTTRTEDLINELPQSIIVTGSRLARQEDLGDLKLYRIRERVTVPAMSQKQVALLERPGVPVETVYRHRIFGDGAAGAVPTLVTRNREAEKLGLPLPAGRVALFQRLEGRRIMIGRGTMEDRAVGEEVEIPLGESTDVRTHIVEEAAFAAGGGDYRLTVTNAKNWPVRFEAEFGIDGVIIRGRSPAIGRRDGRPVWRVTVPANGSAVLRYRVEDPEAG